MASNIVIEPVVTEKDFQDITVVENEAFGPSPLLELIFGTMAPAADGEVPKPGVFHAGLQRRLDEHKNHAAYSTAQYTLARDTSTGKVVGLGRWHFFLDPENPVEPPIEISPFAKQPDLAKTFLGALHDRRAEAMKGKKYFFMMILCVDPGIQRMGIGQKLLDWGLKQADELKLPCWIDASPFGLGLYKKNAWKEVGYFDVELGKWGGKEGEIERTVHLIREPQS